MEFRPVKGESAAWLWLILALPAAAIVLVLWLTVRSVWGVASMSYTLTPSAMTIHFGLDTVVLERSDIATAEYTARLTRGRRLNGTGMPGLYEGSWSFAETGRVRLYATVQRDFVVVRLKDGKGYVFTPDDPHAFLAAFESGQSGVWSPAAGESPGGFVAMMIGLAALTLLPCWLLLYYIRLPRSIRYVLDENGLIIQGGRLHLQLRYDSITDAESAEPKGTPWRTWGAGMPGLYWGSFAWKAAGGSLKLYGTRYKPLILIRAERKLYGITPEDPERFLAELRHRLA